MTASTLAALPRAGEHLGRYTVDRVEPLPEMQGTLVLLRHELGARHAHVIREDDNLAFGVTFPTVPKDSTGVAHILEHVALMGSQKYPVPDPFFAMAPRSLNTFMNAMTANDWTAYPFSTRNVQDYFNLLSVYLDATFFPLLRYESFRQDGHRFEFEKLDDPSSTLKLQGVVYNEMKGAMASAGSVMWRSLGKALYPDLTYAVNSGGEPNDIPNLTYEGLRAFHAAHYHPSNAFFFTYGNQDLGRVLDEIESHVMSRFAPQSLDVSVPDQPSFAEPRRVDVTYPGSDTERGGQVLLAWKLGRSSDPDLNLRWSVLSDVLLGNPAAPLTRPLIEVGHRLSALADLTGYRDSFREGAFAVGLKGLSAGKAAEVEQLVLDTLAGIAREGIARRPDRQQPASIRDWAEGSQQQRLSVWPASDVPAAGAVAVRRRPRDRAAVGCRTGQPAGRSGQRRAGLRGDAGRTAGTAAPRHDGGHARSAAGVTGRAGRTPTRRASQRGLYRRRPRPDRPRELAASVASGAGIRSQRAAHTGPERRDPRRAAAPTTPPLRRAALLVGRVPQPTGGLTYLDVQVRLPELPADLLDVLPLYAYAVTRSGAAGQDYAELIRRIEAVTGGVSASAGMGTRSR